MIFADGDNEPRRDPSEIRLGQDLATWSITDLKERIVALETEIARTNKALEAKSAHLTAVEKLFNT